MEGHKSTALTSTRPSRAAPTKPACCAQFECPVRYLSVTCSPCVRNATGNAAACSLQSAGVRHGADGCAPRWAQSDGTMRAKLQMLECRRGLQTLCKSASHPKHRASWTCQQRGSYIATMLELGSHCRDECLHNPCIQNHSYSHTRSLPNMYQAELMLFCALKPCPRDCSDPIEQHPI